jgi:hypothetical protein
MSVQGIALLREIRTQLSQANVLAAGGEDVCLDIKKLQTHVNQLEQLMAASQEAHAEKLSELMRHYTHYINVWAVRAPPDQGLPELQTVPWMVGRYNTTVAAKGELTRRTAEAPPTVQKPQPKTRGRRGKGAKRTRKDD